MAATGNKFEKKLASLGFLPDILLDSTVLVVLNIDWKRNPLRLHYAVAMEKPVRVKHTQGQWQHLVITLKKKLASLGFLTGILLDSTVLVVLNADWKRTVVFFFIYFPNTFSSRQPADPVVTWTGARGLTYGSSELPLATVRL